MIVLGICFLLAMLLSVAGLGYLGYEAQKDGDIPLTIFSYAAAIISLIMIVGFFFI